MNYYQGTNGLKMRQAMKLPFPVLIKWLDIYYLNVLQHQSNLYYEITFIPIFVQWL